MNTPKQGTTTPVRYSLKTILVVVGITVVLLLIAGYINSARYEAANFQRSLDKITD